MTRCLLRRDKNTPRATVRRNLDGIEWVFSIRIQKEQLCTA